MITGREAVGGLEQAIQQLRGNEGQLDSALRSATDEAARARQAETDGFRALARIKLDQMASTKMLSDLDTTERRALDLIASERVALEALDRRRLEAQIALNAAESDKRESGSALELAIKAMETKHRAIAQTVTTTAEWRAAKQEVSAAQKIADAADEKAKRAVDDLTLKRKPYEVDPLFMYLWQRKHGTSEDHTGFFVRFFDRKIARLISYSDARANYAMLLAIPARLSEHAEARRQAVEEKKAKQGEVERRALIADGIENLETALTNAEAKDADAQAQVAAATQALKAVETERGAIMTVEGSGRSAAIALLADRLVRADMRQLYADAFKTQTPDDENALNAITRARQQIANAEQSAASIRSQIQDLSRRRLELESARDQARLQGYDSPWGDFANHVLISDLIRGVVAGALSSGDLGRAMAEGYRRRDPGIDPHWGGGGSWGGGGPWGGGGNTSSPPPAAGGGWRTTDSF